jgi:hypothetical protein
MARNITINVESFGSTAARDAWFSPSGGNRTNPVAGDICVVRTVTANVASEQVQVYTGSVWTGATSSKHRGDS